MDQLEKSKLLWIYTPLTIIVLTVIGCLLFLECREYCMSIYFANRMIILNSVFTFAKKVGLIILLFLFFKAIKILIIQKLMGRIFKDVGVIDRYNGISKFVSFLLWFVFVLLCLSILIGDLTALVASLGLVGFGLTFALQKPIMNFVGWITIIFGKTYVEGDRIQIGNFIGDVKQIQVMNTVLEGLLETSDVLSGKAITFPNDMVLTSEVRNFTKDSNYIQTELQISITYESDYRKASKLLKSIVTNVVRANKEKYKKRISSRRLRINKFISDLVSKKKLSKQELREQDDEAKKLEMQKQEIEEELKELEEEFKPLIRLEMLDSSLLLVANYSTPYDQIKKLKTDINLAFLDAIADDDSIEIAYPHMQLVLDDDQKRLFKQTEIKTKSNLIKEI